MFPFFDRNRLDLLPLVEREHGLDLDAVLPLEPPAEQPHEHLRLIAKRMVQARDRGAAVVLMMGAHVLRSGVQNYLIDLMENGFISCMATNGAGIIHDFEFSLIGKTTESVSRYIKNGRFGLWKEVGRINDIVTRAAREGLGLGEAIGKAIESGAFPHKDISIFAAGYRLNILLTVHVGIGYDIVCEHPNCDGGAWGTTSYLDFLRFTRALELLEDGVLMNFGSAVMAPEVFLKSLAMVRNAARQTDKKIQKFTTLVCDLQNLPADIHCEPSACSPAYYFRPWKTMLVRTVTDGGEGYYLQAPHAQSIPQLWKAIKDIEDGSPVSYT